MNESSRCKLTPQIYFPDFVKDEITGEIRLTKFAEYYNRLQSKYKNYSDFEQNRMERFVEKASKSVRANFSDSWQL